MARTFNAAPQAEEKPVKTRKAAPPPAAAAPEKKVRKNLPAVRKTTEVGDWRKEMEQYTKRAQATAETQAGNWMSVRGGKLNFKGADIQGSALDSILLDSMLENAYYEGGFDPDSPKPPVCFALGYDADELKPHEASAKPQNENCATCEHNKFGSSTSPGGSGRGKACKNIRRIAFISGDDITANGIADAEIAKLKVPVTSVASLNAHINNMVARCGSAPFITPTHIQVAPHAKHQVEVTFSFPDPKHVARLPDKVMPALIPRVKEAEAQLAEPYAPATEEENAKPARGKRTGKRKF